MLSREQAQRSSQRRFPMDGTSKACTTRLAHVGCPVSSKTGMGGSPSSVGMSMVGGAILFAAQPKSPRHNTETAGCVDSSLSDNNMR